MLKRTEAPYSSVTLEHVKRWASLSRRKRKWWPKARAIKYENISGAPFLSSFYLFFFLLSGQYIFSPSDPLLCSKGFALDSGHRRLQLPAVLPSLVLADSTGSASANPLKNPSSCGCQACAMPRHYCWAERQRRPRQYLLQYVLCNVLPFSDVWARRSLAQFLSTCEFVIAKTPGRRRPAASVGVDCAPGITCFPRATIDE